jgi:hypothetical protein
MHLHANDNFPVAGRAFQKLFSGGLNCHLTLSVFSAALGGRNISYRLAPIRRKLSLVGALQTFSHGCVVEEATFIPRNGPISATIFAEFPAHPVGTALTWQTLE